MHGRFVHVENTRLSPVVEIPSFPLLFTDFGQLEPEVGNIGYIGMRSARPASYHSPTTARRAPNLCRSGPKSDREMRYPGGHPSANGIEVLLVPLVGRFGTGICGPTKDFDGLDHAVRRHNS